MTAPVEPSGAPAGAGVSGIVQSLKSAFGVEPGKLAEPVEVRAQPVTVVDGQVVIGDPLAPDPEPIQPDGELEIPAGPTPEEVEAAEAARKERTIEFPEWSPSEPAMEMEVDDPAVAQRVRALLNARERKSESQDRLNEAAQMMARVNEQAAKWEVDPMGMVQQTLTEDQRVHLAMSILTDGQMFDGLKDTLSAILQDPNALAVVRANLRATGFELTKQAEQAVGLRKAQERNIRDLRTAVDALIPPTLNGEQRRLWRADAMRELGEFASRSNVRIIHPLDVPMLLAPRLRASNVDAQVATTALQHAFARRGPDSAGVSSGPPASPSVPAPKLVAAAKSRAVASSSAPPGAGTPTAQIPPAPAGSGIKGRLAHYAKVRGLGR